VINDVAAGLGRGPGVSPGQVRTLLRARPASPAALAQLTVEPDSAGHAVEVPAAEGAGPADGDDGEIRR